MNHKHTCQDCGLVWEHDLEGCLVDESKGQNYPCIKCMFNGKHLMFFGTTPEAAEEAAELENRLSQSTQHP